MVYGSSDIVYNRSCGDPSVPRRYRRDRRLGISRILAATNSSSYEPSMLVDFYFDIYLSTSREASSRYQEFRRSLNLWLYRSLFLHICHPTRRSLIPTAFIQCHRCIFDLTAPQCHGILIPRSTFYAVLISLTISFISADL